MPKSDEKKMGIREIRLIRGNRDKEGGLRENSAIALGRCHFSLAASAPLVYDVENRCDHPLLHPIGARTIPDHTGRTAAGHRPPCNLSICSSTGP
jgi:hypothetical protein